MGGASVVDTGSAFDVTRSRVGRGLLIGLTAVIIAGEAFMVWLWDHDAAHFAPDDYSRQTYVISIPATIAVLAFALLLMRWRLRVGPAGLELTVAWGITRQLAWREVTDFSVPVDSPWLIIRGPGGRIFTKVNPTCHNFDRLLDLPALPYMADGMTIWTAA